MIGLTRGLATVAAAAIAGFLIWIAAAWINGTGTGPYWARMGLVAAAGLLMALAQVFGGWTKGKVVRLSPGFFLVGFLPVLVCAGWVVVFAQPNSAWVQHHVSAWSNDVGIRDVVQNLRPYVGVLAFAIGMTLGFTFDTAVPAVAAAPVEPVETVDERPEDEPVAAERRATVDDGAVPADRGIERDTVVRR